MIKKYVHDDLTWIDLESPTHDEIKEVSRDYNINPLVADELASPTLRPKVDLYPEFIYLILHFPAFKRSKDHKKEEEIDFIIGHKIFITAHYDNIDPIHAFSKAFETTSSTSEVKIGEHAGYIFFHMIRSLYHTLEDELVYVKNTLSDIEDKIFSGKEKDMVVEISEVNRELLDFKEAISVHKDVLNSFEAASKKFFGEAFDYHLRSIIGEYYKVHSAVDSSKEYLHELRDTNDSLLSAKQNETMKRFTVIAFIFLPISFIAAIFGMSMDKPFIHNTNDFWTVILLMVAIALISLILFKRKKIL